MDWKLFTQLHSSYFVYYHYRLSRYFNLLLIKFTHIAVNEIYFAKVFTKFHTFYKKIALLGTFSEYCEHFREISMTTLLPKHLHLPAAGTRSERSPGWRAWCTRRPRRTVWSPSTAASTSSPAQRTPPPRDTGIPIYIYHLYHPYNIYSGLSRISSPPSWSCPGHGHCSGQFWDVLINPSSCQLLCVY